MSVLGRAHYFLVTEAPRNIDLPGRAEKKHFVSLKLECQSGARARDLRLSKQAALPTPPGLPPKRI